MMTLTGGPREVELGLRRVSAIALVSAAGKDGPFAMDAPAEAQNPVDYTRLPKVALSGSCVVYYVLTTR